MVSRILISVLLLLSVLYWPFWLSVILGIAAMLYFDWYGEAVIIFLVGDILYGIPEPKFFGIIFFGAVSSLIVLVLLQILKKRMMFYNK